MVYRCFISCFSVLYSLKVELLILSIIFLPVVNTSEEVNSPKHNEDIYVIPIGLTDKKLFKLKRVEQLEAVKKMTKIEESKQLQMVKTMTKYIFEVLQKSRTILENAGFIPGVSDFPESESLRDALSLVVENTALMSEMALRLPDVTERVLRSAGDWATLLGWGLTFSGETQLLDNSTVKLLKLVRQELNFTTRDSDYTNPYRKVKHRQLKPTLEEPKKKKKKPPLPRGPRLTMRQEL